MKIKTRYNFKDLTGQKFGRLTVIKQVGKNKHGSYLWFCKCDCGNIKTTVGTLLRKGETKSCGCLSKENLEKGRVGTHRMSESVEYRTWLHIKWRCLNKNCPRYKNYGGRRIKMCNDWLESFGNFYKDMGKRPENKSSIDRIDNNKGYYKENCHWATRTEQARNKRNNKMLIYKGETRCLSDWAEKLNMNYNTLYSKLNMGQSVKKVFNKVY